MAVKKYLVNFVYPHTILMCTVDTDYTDEWQIAENADMLIFEDIGFAPLLGADDWTVEELN